MTNTEEILDALAETVGAEISKARLAETRHREFDAHHIANFYGGRMDALADCQELILRKRESASSQDVNAGLPAVRSTAWLDALAASWERRADDLHERHKGTDMFLPLARDMCVLRACAEELRAESERASNDRTHRSDEARPH